MAHSFSLRFEKRQKWIASDSGPKRARAAQWTKWHDVPRRRIAYPQRSRTGQLHHSKHLAYNFTRRAPGKDSLRRNRKVAAAGPCGGFTAAAGAVITSPWRSRNP